MLRWLLDNGVPCTIAAVTDGEGSHARSDRIRPAELVELRAAERARALSLLGAAAVPVQRLGLPDGDVEGRVWELTRALRRVAGPDICIVAPWREDAHPDHRAVARVALAVAADTGATTWEVPIWGRVAGFDEPCSILELGEFAKRKMRAASEFHTQIRALGPSPADGPVLRPFELCAFLQPTELVVMT
ncbi:MAG: PIG-L family deacetylase [Acidimicrobiales bacterium]